MKKFIQHTITLIAFIIPFSVYAQTDKAYDMNINDVKVIVQPSGNEIVVVQTIIKGGVQNYPADKAGIESLTMTGLTECGTTNDDKNSYKNKLDKISAQVYGGTRMDFATFSLNCIKGDFETAWPLYTDAMVSPRFDAKEFARIKQDAINIIRANESNPDNAVNKMARQTAFAGKDYAKEPQGTVETVTKLTPEETKKYWQSIFTRSKMVIVVVGDLDKAEIEKKVKDFLSKVPAGSPFKLKEESYSPSVNSFNPKERENATNYIQGITGAPLPGTADYNAFVLAMRIFSTRHFIEIRSKNGLSYAPGSWFSQGRTPYANFFVTTTQPDKYIAVARNLIDKVKKDGFTEEELKNEKTGYLTGLYYRQETNEEQAAALATNEVVHNNWKRAVEIKNEINKVTLEDANNAFKKYITNITWVYQGDPKKVDSKLYVQKETPPVPADKKAF
jgi:predicted Zn-dependent peptidase